jgi:hypothetical protein
MYRAGHDDTIPPKASRARRMNAFERHGLDHLSASSCNLFAAQPALWVAEKLLGRKAPVGAAAHRGSAVEAGIAKGLLEPEKWTVDDCVAEAENAYRNKTALSGDPKREAAGKLVGGMVRTILPELCAYGPGVVCQEKIEWSDPEISVPFIGYADFYWPEHGALIELKTQERLSSSIRIPHARQVALYAGGLGDNVDARVCYGTPHKAAVYGLENVRDHLNCLRVIGRTIERFLSISQDSQELAGLLVPDVDSFYWNDPKARQVAWEVWAI